jgi:hypothetical protein
MREQQNNNLQSRSHKRKCWIHGISGPQCIKMLVISINDVMCVNPLEGLIHKVWST